MNDNKQHLSQTTEFMDSISNSTNGTVTSTITSIGGSTQQPVTTIGTMMMEIYHNPALNLDYMPATESFKLWWPTSTIVTVPDVAWSTSDEFNDPGYTLRYGLLGSVALR